jgi:hypothetical protein
MNIGPENIGPTRTFVAAARHGGIPLQQNGKWLIFGKDSRAACVIPGLSA